MSTPVFSLRDVRLGYGEHTVIDGLNLDVAEGSFTTIIGRNGCGKSTLLRGMSRLLRPTKGTIRLSGENLAGFNSRSVARRMSLLAQSAHAPAGILVKDLVARGRYPYQGLWRHSRTQDTVAIADAMEQTNITALAERRVEELSGGQRQRVWVAMALAQATPILLLDEPTTFLDIAHQVELLDLFTELNQAGRTIVAVLHDLNQAARYSTDLVAMRDGAIAAHGSPDEVVTSQIIQEVFDVDNIVLTDPASGSPLVIPRQQRGRSLTRVHDRLL